jgi:hypothetical protein
MNILSIDCGVVSMSLTVINVVNSAGCVVCLKTTDISKYINKNSPLPRVDATTRYIHEILLQYLTDIDAFILIEKQIPATTTYDIMITLYTVLSTMGYKNIHIVDPRLKNKYTIDIGIAEFSTKYLNKYTANKAFAVYNFDKKIKEFDCSKTIIDYPKKYKKDIADSFMQLIAWLDCA